MGEIEVNLGYNRKGIKVVNLRKRQQRKGYSDRYGQNRQGYPKDHADDSKNRCRC
jgi:hypothetical protein